MKVLKVTKPLSLDNPRNKELFMWLIDRYNKDRWSWFLYKNKNRLYEFVTEYPIPGCEDFKRHEVDGADCISGKMALRLINGNNNGSK